MISGNVNQSVDFVDFVLNHYSTAMIKSFLQPAPGVSNCEIIIYL